MDDLQKTLKMLLYVESAQLEEMDRLFHMLEEMTGITDNFLVWIIKYCDEHKIPIWTEEQLKNYITMSRMLLKEIGKKTSNLNKLIKSRKLPLRKFDRRSPEDLPEPK